MEFIKNGEGSYTLELTERNLRVLLAKLKDPHSQRTIGKLGSDYKSHIFVKAVPDEAHYADRAPGEMAHEPLSDDEEIPVSPESFCMVDNGGDMWAFIEGYGWDPVYIQGEHYPDGPVSPLSGFPSLDMFPGTPSECKVGER